MKSLPTHVPIWFPWCTKCSEADASLCMITIVASHYKVVHTCLVMTASPCVNGQNGCETGPLIDGKITYTPVGKLEISDQVMSQ
jgi:hypothetical protein